MSDSDLIKILIARIEQLEEVVFSGVTIGGVDYDKELVMKTITRKTSGVGCSPSVLKQVVFKCHSKLKNAEIKDGGHFDAIIETMISEGKLNFIKDGKKLRYVSVNCKE